MDEFKYIAFYKPYGVLSQFRGEKNDRTLSEFDFPKNVYAAGRLDKDSEGLLLLTDDGIFNQKITNPKSNKSKIYRVQVEGIPSSESLEMLQKGGISIKDYLTKPCQVAIIDDFQIEDRVPPIRYRKNIPTTWIELAITEGKNRQVRRMTAAIGHPTLRLIRYRIGKLELSNLRPGDWTYVKRSQII